MMDLKEIIKWFIPCFHILQVKSKSIRAYLTLFCLFLFFNSCAGLNAKEKSGSDMEMSGKVYENTKKLGFSVDKLSNFSLNPSGHLSRAESNRNFGETAVGRTFGRPFKKMMAGLLPIVFQIGAASTWAVVAALVGFKTLLVTLVILKILLLAGAAKVGALFASKTSHSHGSHGWEPPQQKEIHLHIHNGQPHHEETQVPYSAWSREGNPLSENTKNINVVIDPYQGPQTISTPYGNYVKVDPSVDPNATL